MRPHRSLKVPSNVDELIGRLGRLQPTTVRRWGSMTSHEMVCHLADSFRVVTGNKPASAADTFLSRSLVKWIAIHTPLPWPQGVPTRPEVDPKREGTQPADFEHDRATVVELLRHFVAPGTRCVNHPFFGPMTRNEWLLWGYGHVDHHLRQFGL